MKTIEQLADLGTQAIQRFDLRVPIHGSTASITQRTSFANRDACLAFAAAVRDALQLDTSAEITHLRDN